MSGSRDRGQVLLVGAITVAIVFLALVAVVTGLVYTEATSSSATGNDRATTRATIHGLVDGIELLAASARNDETAQFDADLEGEIDEYVDWYRRTTVAGERVTLSVRAEVLEDEREVRRYTGARSPAAGPPRFDGEIARFRIEPGAALSDEEIVITATPEEGATRNITIAPTGDGAVSFRSPAGASCRIESTEAEFNLLTGGIDANATVPDDCEYDAIDRGIEYETIRVDPTSDAVLGSYDVVSRGPNPRTRGGDPAGVEFVDLEVRSDTGSTTSERTHRIMGFGDPS
ncbi:DUF7261 family protein [Halostagnicola kamekurae]|uniref:Uncharacterized protein n=1 Tax=Halostagnicola kamekurae TaxID=619731 RepID=A0A1I6SFQ9_9EURY|nr:hypothetical protein [Halostagnicola kamekurae]SFS75821.1 hypothetical protein SAMN04488556_2641 [Halostagnicola kamekurae]